MNSSELSDYRRIFYTKLEESIKENKIISIEDYYVILAKTIKTLKTDQKDSKNILVYIGSYINKKNKFTEDNSEYLIYDENPKITYKLYKDIETDLIYKIKLKKVKKFEKNNKIIYPKIEIYNLQEYDKQYDKIKLKYYKKILYSKQNEAYKLVKKLYE